MKHLILSSILFLSLSPAAFSADGDKARAAGAANNEFGFGLFKATAEKTNVGNKFLSPISAYTALSMLYNGATGTCAQEIAATLATKGLNRADLNRMNVALLGALNQAGGDEFTLSLANSAWAKDGFKFKDAFANSLLQNYAAATRVLDFGIPEASSIINQWVAEATHEKIRSIVPNKIPDTLKLILINATYFEAKWSHPFDPIASRLDTFDVPGKKFLVPFRVATLHQRAHLRYARLADGAEVVELPYGKTQDVRMIVVLPAKTDTLPEFESRLTSAAWAKTLAAIEAVEPEEGSLSLPKLKLEYKATLNKPLSTMGMNRAFTRADELGDIANEPLTVSQILQKTFLEVDELGTKAAAVTSIGVGGSAMPQFKWRLNVNRPYFFAIEEKKTGTILFMGSITEPEGGKMPEMPKR